MKININTLLEGKIYNFEEDIIIDNISDTSYGLKRLENIHVKADVTLFEDLLSVYLSISGNAVMICSYSLEEGDYKIRLKENLTFTLNEENEDEDMIYDGRSTIILDDYIRSLILASLPTKFVKKGKTLPTSGENYRVLTEDDFVNEHSKKKNSPFDKLANIDIEE